MNLTPMRYKDYVWPHNPKIYEITFERKLAVNKIPFGRYFMQDMGMNCRILRGEGEFAGEGAYEEFKKLATVFYDGKPGILIHPVWQLSNAYFASLSLKQEPYEDYVSYEFEFWERYDGYDGELKKISTNSTEKKGGLGANWKKSAHTVIYGDTMWAIARRYGMTLSELIRLNPQIGNPNRIYPGDIIYLQ